MITREVLTGKTEIIMDTEPVGAYVLVRSKLRKSLILKQVADSLLGMHLAERNMWRIAAKLLWAFEFAESVDAKTGKIMPIDADAYNRGILQAPLPFNVKITPRSAGHISAIKREMAGAKEFLAPWDS
jgi:hypothetical protein